MTFLGYGLHTFIRFLFFKPRQRKSWGKVAQETSNMPLFSGLFKVVQKYLVYESLKSA